MKVEITTKSGVPVYGLDAITPEVFDRLDSFGMGVVVCVDGDLSKSYIVTWKDKGCDEDGVYYKGCVGKLADSDYCGHYDAIWFNRKTFRSAVSEFISKGGNFVLPYVPSSSWFCWGGYAA